MDIRVLFPIWTDSCCGKRKHRGRGMSQGHQQQGLGEGFAPHEALPIALAVGFKYYLIHREETETPKTRSRLSHSATGHRTELTQTAHLPLDCYMRWRDRTVVSRQLALGCWL
jgi:hypothetical protein